MECILRCVAVRMRCCAVRSCDVLCCVDALRCCAVFLMSCVADALCYSCIVNIQIQIHSVLTKCVAAYGMYFALR